MKETKPVQVTIVDEQNIVEMTLKATTLSDDFVDQELEDAANEWVDSHYIKGAEYFKTKRGAATPKSGFIAGANWKAKQLSTHAIEFAKWIIENYWSLDDNSMWYDRTKVHPGQHYDGSITSEQLYELWQQSKKK
jgi:hypothetical protein